YSRRADKEARRAYGVIAQLERSAHRQEQLVADARSARADLQQSDVLRQKQQLQHQSEELRQKISGAGGEEVSALRMRLQEASSRQPATAIRSTRWKAARRRCGPTSSAPGLSSGRERFSRIITSCNPGGKMTSSAAFSARGSIRELGR